MQYGAYHSVNVLSVGYSNGIEQVKVMKEVIVGRPAHNKLMLGWLMVHMIKSHCGESEW